MKKISLRAARAQAGFGKGETAKKLGVDPGTLWRWERGKMSPPADVAERMCRLYGIAFEDIEWERKDGK